ncbi:MAG: ferrous iron transport protein A [Lachnospiraceae bacterium]|nr:ferrous iron transport protein A [Lachnospiraceae bacterium]MCR5778179.1 ferrous iron transport protein A [Lachnospiraceae bacterium]
MMPLTMANAGESLRVIKVGGLEDTKRFLNNLGFTEGAEVSIVSKIAGNLIVNIRDSRIALDNEMAKKIMV